nr:MAG TPA: hypothetical protein [Caudoviricetes sp.]
MQVVMNGTYWQPKRLSSMLDLLPFLRYSTGILTFLD